MTNEKGGETSGRAPAIAFIGDVAVLSLFPLIGTLLHRFELDGSLLWRTLMPFGAGWLAVGILAGAYRQRTLASVTRTLLTVAGAWLGAALIGAMLRWLIFDTLASPTFFGVVVGTGCAMLLTWRLLLLALVKAVPLDVKQPRRQ